MNRRKRKALLKMAVDGSNDYMDKLVITVRFHPVFVSDLLPLNFHDYFYEYYECSAQFEKAEAFFYHIVWEVFNEYGFICWNAGDSLHESIMDAEFKYRFKNLLRFVMIREKMFTMNPLAHNSIKEQEPKCIIVGKMRVKTYEEAEELIRQWLNGEKAKMEKFNHIGNAEEEVLDHEKRNANKNKRV